MRLDKKTPTRNLLWKQPCRYMNEIPLFNERFSHHPLSISFLYSTHIVFCNFMAPLNSRGVIL